MKLLILLIASFLFVSCVPAQSFDCKSIDKIISIQGGYPTNISIQGGFEANFWGLFVGVKGIPYKIPGNEIYPSSNSIHVNPFIKASFHALGNGEDDWYRVYIIGYIGTNKLYGYGLRLGVIAANDLMIFTENTYGDQKLEGNIGLSFRF